MLNRELYNNYVERYRLFWKWCLAHGYDLRASAWEVCKLRGYPLEGEMFQTLVDAEVLQLKDYAYDEIEEQVRSKTLEGLGLFSKEGKFLLRGRYIIPIRDMLGNVVALVGWYPDEKRYITTPSDMFSKSGMFFGMEQLVDTGLNKDYVLVEGIFDSLAVRSLGYNCVAMMGSLGSAEKQVLYGLFGKLVAVPDNDKTGRGVIERDKWKLPVGSSYMNWVEDGAKIKDIDDLIKYDRRTAKDMLEDALSDGSRVVTFRLS